MTLTRGAPRRSRRDTPGSRACRRARHDAPLGSPPQARMPVCRRSVWAACRAPGDRHDSAPRRCGDSSTEAARAPLRRPWSAATTWWSCDDYALCSHAAGRASIRLRSHPVQSWRAVAHASSCVSRAPASGNEPGGAAARAMLVPHQPEGADARPCCPGNRSSSETDFDAVHLLDDGDDHLHDKRHARVLESAGCNL